MKKKNVVLSEEARRACAAFPCGQCMPCRINRSRVWITRILLEQLEWEKSSFITLTYDEDNCPEELNKKHLSDFWKRLRHYSNLRYFAVGEYGLENDRPHYHAALFGFSPEENDIIEKKWSHGFTMTGTLEQSSASYITEYILKAEKNREWSTMSRRPPIGGKYIDKLSKILKNRETIKGKELITNIGLGRSKRPLGKFLTKKLNFDIHGGVKAEEMADLSFYEHMNEVFDLHLKEDNKYAENIVAEKEHDRHVQEKRRNIYTKRRRL